jgi:hypothetical protein
MYRAVDLSSRSLFFIFSGAEDKTSASLETIDLTPETVDEILEHKSVKEFE